MSSSTATRSVAVGGGSALAVAVVAAASAAAAAAAASWAHSMFLQSESQPMFNVFGSFSSMVTRILEMGLLTRQPPKWWEVVVPLRTSFWFLREGRRRRRSREGLKESI